MSNKLILAYKDRIKSIFSIGNNMVPYDIFEESLVKIFKELSNAELIDNFSKDTELALYKHIHRALIDEDLLLVDDSETIEDFFNREKISYLNCKVNNLYQKNTITNFSFIFLHDSDRLRKNEIESVIYHDKITDYEKSNEAGLCYEITKTETSIITFFNLTYDTDLEIAKAHVFIQAISTLLSFIHDYDFRVESIIRHHFAIYLIEDTGLFNSDISSIILACEIYSKTQKISVREIKEFLFTYYENLKLRFDENEAAERIKQAVIDADFDSNKIKQFIVCESVEKRRYTSYKKNLKEFKDRYDAYFNINQ